MMIILKYKYIHLTQLVDKYELLIESLMLKKQKQKQDIRKYVTQAR